MLNVITGLLDAGIPPVTNSYESIATVTVGSGGSSTISFSSIPSTYKHLQIRLMETSSSPNNDIVCRFNSDSGTTYSLHALLGSGASASAYATANNTYVSLGYTGSSSNSGVAVADILDYADTNKYKTVRSLGGLDQNGSGYILLQSGGWRSTSAINAITITHGAGVAFAQYSSFALYGIKG